MAPNSEPPPDPQRSQREPAQPEVEQHQAEQAAANEAAKEEGAEGPLSLADELGVEELREIVFVDQGRMFSAAGRSAPIAELTDDDNLLMRPPEKPLSDELPVENIVINVDERGILLNELMEPRKFVGAKFHGRALYYLGETNAAQRHYVGCFDESGVLKKLYLQGNPVTVEIIYKLRVRTLDGEMSIFPELTDDPRAHLAAPE